MDTLKDARQLGCVFQDTKPPESLPILQKSTKVLGSIRRVRFTKATQRHANIRENKGPWLGTIQVEVLRQRRPYALKFEDRSQEEKEKDKSYVFSPREHPIRGESHVDFLGESEGSPPPRQDSLPDDGEAINDFWTMSGNFIFRHHVEPRVKLYSPREESFPIPLRYIDVTRATSTTLDVMLERRMDDYWNIEGNRDLSDSWKDRVHTIHHIGRRTSRWVYMVWEAVGEETNYIQA